MTRNGWRVETVPPGSYIVDAFAGVRVTHPNGTSIVQRIGNMYARVYDTDGQLVGMVRAGGMDEHTLGRVLSQWLREHP